MRRRYRAQIKQLGFSMFSLLWLLLLVLSVIILIRNY